MPEHAPSTPAAGLSSAEAARRRAERPPDEGPGTSRSWASILRANVFTVFNLVLVAAGVVTLIFGDPQDAIFLAILVYTVIVIGDHGMNLFAVFVAVGDGFVGKPFVEVAAFGGSTVTRTFTVTNDGDAQLVLTNLTVPAGPVWWWL